MRTFLLALAFYLVIALPLPDSGDTLPSAATWALARPAPANNATAGTPARDETASPFEPADQPETTQSVLEPALQDAAVDVAPALFSAETFEELRKALLELARPAGKPTKAEMCETLVASALAHDLPVGFFVRLIQQESGFNPEVVSSAGAQGVAQFMPAVAEEWGLKDPFDPHQALPASARFLRSLRQQFGNWGLAAAAYNGGSGRLQKWLDKRGKLPEETRKYVLSITGIPAEKWVGDGKKVNFTIPERAPCKDIALPADFDDDDDDDFPLPRPRVTPTIIAEARSPKPQNPGKAQLAVKLAEKSPAKSSAKTAAKNGKKSVGKGRVQVADARASRK